MRLLVHDMGHLLRCGISFTANGRSLSIVTVSGELRKYDLVSGHDARLLLATSSVRLADFSPDGSRVAVHTAPRDQNRGPIAVHDTSSGLRSAVFSGHSGEVRELRYNPNGSELATVDTDGTVKLWDVESAREKASAGGYRRMPLCTSLSPDGATLATGSRGGRVRLWDVANGQKEADFLAHADAVTKVSFSPDGALLATACANGVLKLWEVPELRERSVLRGHSAFVCDICFDATSATLASVSRDRTVRLWDVATGLERARGLVAGARDIFLHIAFSPDGKILVTHLHGRVLLWDTRSGRQEASFRGGPVYIDFPNPTWVAPMAFSPDGKELALGGSENSIVLWDVATRKEKVVLRGHSAPVTNVSYSPNGLLLASAGLDRSVKLWDAATGLEKATLRGHSDTVLSVCFSPDGALLASAGRDGTVRLWDPATYREKGILYSGAGAAVRVDFSADGYTLLSESADSTVKLWDLGAASERTTLKVSEEPVMHVCLSHSGSTIAALDDDSNLHLWDAAAGRERKVLTSIRGNVVSYLRFSPDDEELLIKLDRVSSRAPAKFLDLETGVDVSRLQEAVKCSAVSINGSWTTLASGGPGSQVRIWDFETGSPKASFEMASGEVCGIGLNPDGTLVACGTAEGSVTIVEVATGHKRYALNLGFPPRWVLFAPDGQTLACMCSARAKLFDVRTGREKTFGYSPFRGRLSPDGKLFALTDTVGFSLKIWDMKESREVASLTDTDEEVLGMEFSRDSTMLGYAVRSGVEVWGTRTGSRVATFTGHSGPANSVSWSSDGRTLASGGEDGTVRLWHISSPRQIRMDDAVGLTGGSLDSFEIVPETERFVAHEHFAPSEGFRFAKKGTRELGRSRFGVAQWREDHPNRWLPGVRRGEAKALYHLAVIRERQGKDAEARILHQRAADVGDPVQKEWSKKSRWRLSKMPWLQPGSAQIERPTSTLDEAPAGDATVPALVAALSDDSDEARVQALEALTAIGKVRSPGGLIDAVRGRHGPRRDRITVALYHCLHQLGPESAVPALVKALDDKEAGVRLIAATLLGKFGPDAEPAVPALIAALGSEDIQLRVTVATALGDLGPTALSAVAALIESLKDRHHEVRRSAARALGRLGDPKAIGPLRELRDGDSVQVWAAALRSLYELGAKEAKSSLQLTEGLAALMDAVCSSDVPARRRAAQGLAAMGPAARAAIPALGTALQDQDPVLRASSAKALGEIGSDARAAIPHLVRALADEYADVRQSAARALGLIGDPAAIVSLQALRSKDTIDIEVALVRSLHQLGVEGLMATVEKTEKLAMFARRLGNWSPSSGSPRDTIEALSGMGRAARPVVSAFAAVLARGDDEVRLCAIRVLRRIGGPDAIGALESIEYNDGSEIEAAVLDALHELGVTVTDDMATARRRVGELGRMASSDDSEACANANLALGKMAATSKLAVSVLLRNLGNMRWQAPGVAARALANDADDPRVMPALLHALTKKYSHDYEHCESLHSGVCWALGEIGDERAVAPLIDELLTKNDKDIGGRMAAAAALAKIGGKDATEALTKATADENEKVKEAAAAALRSVQPAGLPEEQ